MRRLVLSLLTFVALGTAVVPATASAGFSLGEPFALPTGTKVEALAVGAEGDLWFGGSVTGARQGNVLGRISMDGKVDEFQVPESSAAPGVGGLAQGPDGNMWFTQPAANRVGWMTTTGQTGGFQSPDPGARPTGIVSTPDGSVWVTLEGTGKIVKVDPATGAATEFPLATGWRPTAIALGSDSALWAIDRDAPQLVRQPTAGRGMDFTLPTEGGNFTPGTTNSDIIAGPDGNLWLSQSDGPFVAKLKAIGGQTEYVRYRLPIRGGTSFISSGPKKDIFYASGGLIGSLAPRNLATGETLCAVQGCDPVTALAEGPDGKLWFAAGRLVGNLHPPDLGTVLPKSVGRPQGKKVSVTIGCYGGLAGDACAGTVSLRLADKPRSAISSFTGFHVPTTGQAKVKVTLNRAGVASLAAQGKLRVQLVARLGAKVAGLRNYTLRAGR